GSIHVTSGATLASVGTTSVPPVVNDGTLQPGGGAGGLGILNIQGYYTQTSTGALSVDLAGPAASQYDVVNVGGNALLDGTLNVNYVGGYTGVGGVHNVLNYTSASGTFATVHDVGGLVPTYGSTVFSLTSASGLNIWTGGASTLNWGDALNWSLGHE